MPLQVSRSYRLHARMHFNAIRITDNEMTGDSAVNCDSDDDKLGLAVGLTFFITLLLTALLAVVVGIIVVVVDRKRCEKKAPEQVPTNTVAQNVYGSQD